MIKLTDFMQVPHPNLTKVKFNMRAGAEGVDALDLLFADDPQEWLDMNRHRSAQPSNNFGSSEYLLSFAQYHPYGPRYFIFGGFFRVAPIDPPIFDAPGYELIPQEEFAGYIKRLIVKLENPVGRDVYLRRFDTLQDGRLNPLVHELSPATKLGTFSGYQNVKLRHRDLQRIVKHSEPIWKEALSSVKGVYVITDLSDGRLYVGSASGEANGLWQRWSAYAKLKNPTGENTEFKNIVERLGADHIVENFQYTILEIFDPKTRDDLVTQRESFWKLALGSRLHGMNGN